MMAVRDEGVNDGRRWSRDTRRTGRQSSTGREGEEGVGRYCSRVSLCTLDEAEMMRECCYISKDWYLPVQFI